MTDLPTYFDSQAQAAAMLHLDVYDLKDAKAAGCPAFKGGGRIRRDELLEWLEKHPPRKSKRRAQESTDEIVTAEDWKNRREMLFEIMEFLHAAYIDKRIDLKKYHELVASTVEPVIQICKAWGVEINPAGYRKTWRANVAEAALRKNEENKHARSR